MAIEQTHDKISITSMCDGKKISIKLYGPHSLNEEGNVMPFNMQMAIVSHYLHNKGTRYAKPFEHKAEGLIYVACNLKRIA